MQSVIRSILSRGVAIPASPLALNAARKLDERRQRALFRYYAAAGVGGIAVGVHTTQFAIRDPAVGLFEPVLQIGREEMDRADAGRGEPLVRIAGICGEAGQALKEAETIARLGYHAGLLSLGAMKNASESELISHMRAVVEIIPVIGFYLQPAVGGRVLPHSFWRAACEIENLMAIKIAPFNRYQTLDVVRAVVEAGREDVALYTGNDDNIVADLVTPFRFVVNGRVVEKRIVGGLLGHWSVWVKKAVELLNECRAGATPKLLAKGVMVTDSNAAFFDAAHGFEGCIAGLHEVLRRQGLLEGIWCLDPKEGLSLGQLGEIDRVYRAYPELNDDEFVARGRDDWLKG